MKDIFRRKTNLVEIDKARGEGKGRRLNGEREGGGGVFSERGEAQFSGSVGEVRV